jgi:ATPase subunit of ABC transporter with duplicated ATPase domains
MEIRVISKDHNIKTVLFLFFCRALECTCICLRLEDSFFMQEIKEACMFQIRNVNLYLRKDLRPLLEDFSLVLNSGDKAVIIGEEGDGKSTLLKWIYDPALVSGYAEANGERIIHGAKTGYLPQELSQKDNGSTVYAYFAESDAFLLKTPGELAKLAAEMHLDIAFFYRDQRMHTLSGGEKVKAQLMRILMEDPDVLLLDEPSNDIDMETLVWLESFILHVPQPVLYVSHDEVLIEHTANMVIHMEQLNRKHVSRCTIMHMSYTEYVSWRQANMANRKSLALTQRKEQKIHEEKLSRIRQKVEHDQASVSRQDPHGGKLLKKKMHVVKAMERRYEKQKQNMAEIPETESSILLQIGDDSSTVPSGKTVLDYSLPVLRTPDGSRVLSGNIHLFIKGPEKICITGRNGAGKTTLLRKIAEELLARSDLKAEYMSQNYADLLDDSLTPISFLAPSGSREDVTRTRTMLGSLRYTPGEMEHGLSELSGGQKAKVLLLKLSLSQADVLILDEPTRNFSPLSGPVIRKALHDFPGAIISVSHDRRFIREVCSRIYVLSKEGLQETGEL